MLNKICSLGRSNGVSIGKGKYPNAKNDMSAHPVQSHLRMEKGIMFHSTQTGPSCAGG